MANGKQQGGSLPVDRHLEQLVECVAHKSREPDKGGGIHRLRPFDIARAALAECPARDTRESSHRGVATGNALVKNRPPALVRENLERIGPYNEVEMRLISGLLTGK